MRDRSGQAEPRCLIGALIITYTILGVLILIIVVVLGNVGICGVYAVQETRTFWTVTPKPQARDPAQFQGSGFWPQ